MSTKSVIEFPKDYVVLDLETTGLSAKFDAIIEIAVIRYRDDKPKASFSSIINPAMPHRLAVRLRKRDLRLFS